MHLFIFLPGVLGSALKQTHAPKGIIWPPGSVDAFNDRTFVELTDDLEPHGIITDVCFQTIYSPIFDMFGQAGIPVLKRGPKPARAFLPFDYDWRISLSSIADRLAQKIESVTGAGDEVTVVAHSMGTAIVRYLLESGRYASRPALKPIKRFVSINGPLRGAPVMLARSFGLDPTDFIKFSEQTKILAAPGFSAGYTLMPAPWEKHLFNGAAPIDIYDPANSMRYGLGAQNMRDATAFWQTLASDRRNGAVEYILISSLLDDDHSDGGTTGSTIERVTYTGGRWTREYGPGDGAVPPWSSKGLSGATVTMPIPGEHLGVIKTNAFRKLFGQYVAALPPQAAAEEIHIQALVLNPMTGTVGEFSVINEADAKGGDATVTWARLSTRGLTTQEVGLTEKVAIAASRSTVVRTRVPQTLGNYLVTIEADGRTASTRVTVRPYEAHGDIPAPPEGNARASRR